MAEVSVAVLGACGWMGRVHRMAWTSFPQVFGTAQGTARLTVLVERNPEAAAELARLHPGARILTDWQAAVTDPEVDLVDICLPDHLHHSVARAALLAGKHVACEKPLAETATQARELADLARARGLVTRVGHAFPRHPVHDLAQEIIRSGEIGAVRTFKGCQQVDTFADPLEPFNWRADGALAPTGIVGDTGTHVFSFMAFLVGRISAVIADSLILTSRRPLPGGEGWAEVTNPDAMHLLCRFENGAAGVVDFSRAATGRKFRQTWEIHGTRGSLAYDYDQPGRLHLYTNDDRPGRRGFRAIDIGPEHPTWAAFLPLPNLALGYNETKVIEAAEVVRQILTGAPGWPDFETGHHICQIVDACMRSAAERRWIDIPGATA